MVLLPISQPKEYHQFPLFIRIKPFQILLRQQMNAGVVPDKLGKAGLTMIHLSLQIVQILGKFEPMINFDTQFNLPEICIWNNDLPQDAGLDHSYQRRHLFEVGVQRVWDDVVDLVWRLMFQHQKISVNTEKTTTQWTLLGLLHYASSLFFADEMYVTFLRVRGKEIRTQISQFYFLELFITHYNRSLKVFPHFHENTMLSKRSHSDVDQFLIPVSFDNVDHLLGDCGLGLEFEEGVAVGVVEDHLIDFYRDASHGLDQLLLLLPVPQARRKKNGIFTNHRVFISEISREEYSAHMTSEEDHSRSRDMFRIEEGNLNSHLILNQIDEGRRVVIVSDDSRQFGVFMQKKFASLMRGMDGPVVPERREALVVVAVEVREEVDETVLREGLAEVEVVHQDVAVRNYTTHCNYYRTIIRANARDLNMLRKDSVEGLWAQKGDLGVGGKRMVL